MAVESQIEIVLSNGAKAGETLKELRKQAAALNREVNDLKPGTEEFVKKSADLQKVSGRMGEIRSQIKGTTQASNELKGQFAQYIPFAGTLQRIGQNLGLVQKGVGGLNTSLGALKAALVSTGIGAIVVVLGLLINYLTSTQAGIDKLTAVTRPLQAILARLQGVLQQLGEKLFKQLGEAIENPRQAIIDLGNAIKENLISRFEALALFGPALAKIFRGEFADGFKDLGNAVIQVSTGIENGIDKIGKAASELGDFVDEAVAQGKRLDELQKAIERAEINRITRSKELELVIAQQKAIVEDETRSYDARRQAAENALAAQQALLNEELFVLDKRIEKMRLEQSLNDTSREQEKELAELQAQRLEIQARVTDQSIEFAKKVNELNRAQAAEELAIVQNLQDLKIEAMQEGMDKEIEEINLGTERRIEALTGSAEQIREQENLLEEIRLREIQAIRDRYATEQADKDKKAKEEKDKRDKEAAQKAIELAQKEADEKRIIEEAYLNFSSGALDIAIGLLGEDEAARKKNAAAIKAFTTAKILVDLQTEIAGYFANPASTATLGVVGAIKTALAVIRATTAIRQVVKQRFSLGGILKGPSHAQRGIPMVDRNGNTYGEAEGDEIVLAKGVYRNPRLRRAASIINVLGGGRKFEAGGPINPLTSSPSLAGTRESRETAESLVDMSSMALKLDELIQAQNQRMDRIKVVNVVTDTEDGIRTVNQIRDEADV